MPGQIVDLMREETRNQLLRRVDWRFLLSNPYPARAVCFSEGALAQSVSAISDQMVLAPENGTGQCDLAVALNPDRSTLQQAWLALQPGGECYLEWYWPSARGTGYLMRRLQAIGFEDIHGYWPWPWPQRTPAFWLPLDAPGLITYFLRERARIGSRTRRILFKLRERAWHFAKRAGMLRPLCVTARKPSARKPGARPAGINDQLPDLHAHDLRPFWPEWGLGASPERLYALLLTGGQHSINKVVSLIAPSPHAAPQLLVKRPRIPQAREGLQHEAFILQQIPRRYPHLSGIPRLVFSGETGPAFSLGETILDGAPLYTCLGRGTFRILAQQAATWLIGLAGTPDTRRNVAPVIERLCAELHELYQAELSEALWQQTRSLLASLGELPAVCEQRDFSPWNVLIDAQGRWNVLDWEAAELDGLPARDLIYFLTYLSFFVEGIMESGEFRVAYRRLLDPTSFTGAVFVECLARYAQAVGFEAHALKALRVLTWMHNAASERLRLNARHEVRPNSLFITLWEEELKEQTREC